MLDKTHTMAGLVLRGYLGQKGGLISTNVIILLFIMQIRQLLAIILFILRVFSFCGRCLAVTWFAINYNIWNDPSANQIVTSQHLRNHKFEKIGGVDKLAFVAMDHWPIIRLMAE